MEFWKDCLERSLESERSRAEAGWEYLKSKVFTVGVPGCISCGGFFLFFYFSIWDSRSMIGSPRWSSVLYRTRIAGHHDAPLFLQRHALLRSLLFPMVVPRIPYTLPFPPPKIRPSNAITLPAAIAAVKDFLQLQNTVFLTGAGISVESGLADYRGDKGTYRLNQKYRPIFFAEFVGDHESRKRYDSPSRELLQVS